MKKFLLSLGAVFVALSGMSASSQRDGLIMTKRPDVGHFAKSGKAKAPSSLRKIAPGLTSAEDVITSVEGEKVDVTVTTSGITMSGFGFTEFKNTMYGSHIVYGNDSEVYIYEIFPYLPTNSYVKGVKEGDKIFVDLPQPIYYEFAPDLGFPEAYYMSILNLNKDEQWYWPEEKAILTLNIDSEGTMTAEGLSRDVILGVADSDDGTWIGLGAWDLSISEFKEAPVTVPEGLEIAENFWTCVGDGYGWQINFAQDGKDVYMQGLSERMPDVWVKGTMETEGSSATVSIAQNQYVGDFAGYHIYTECVAMTVDNKGNIFYEGLMDPDYVYQLVWDTEKGTMVPKDSDVVLLFNTSKSDVYFINDLLDMKLIRQESFDGTPLDPYGLVFLDVMQEEEYSVFTFSLPGISTEGDFLMVDDLSYLVYVDDEVWTFDAEEYMLEESFEEIPWTFDGDWIFKQFESTEHKVAFFVEGITTLGVQSVYRYGGKETRSAIVTINVDEVESVDGLAADCKIEKVTYYDVAGREVKEPANGIFLKVKNMSDGSICTEKHLR